MQVLEFDCLGMGPASYALATFDKSEGHNEVPNCIWSWTVGEPFLE